MHPELEPPPMTRRLAQPARQLGLLLALAVLPIACLVGGLDEQAKSELGRLSPFELVTLMLIPEILSNAVQGQASLVPSLAGLSTVFLLVLLTSLLSQNFRSVQQLLESPPAVLVVDGKLQERTMNRERIAPDELTSEMHKQGLLALSEVRFAILEAGGSITFIPVAPLRQKAADEPKQP